MALRPAVELQVDDPERVQRLGHVRRQRMRRGVRRAGQRRHDRQPPRQPNPPRPYERQGAEADQEDESAGDQARSAHGLRVLERAREPERPSKSLIAAHEHGVGDRPRGRRVARPGERTRLQGGVAGGEDGHASRFARSPHATVGSVGVRTVRRPEPRSAEPDRPARGLEPEGRTHALLSLATPDDRLVVEVRDAR